MPVYTYRCPQGHEWDEFRSLSENSQASADPCATCMEAFANERDYRTEGTKIVSTGMTAIFKGRGWTPRFYRRNVKR